MNKREGVKVKTWVTGNSLPLVTQQRVNKGKQGLA